MSEVRDKFVAVKVSLEERKSWHELAEAHDLGLSDYVRMRVGSSKLSHRMRSAPRPTRRVDPALLRELARIGNNLNQIGRWANTHASDADAVQVLAALVFIERELVAIRNDPAVRAPGASKKTEPAADDE
jgi:hypothetical protein